MPRALWKGSIAFGLVEIPVALVSAEKSEEDISFSMLDRRDFSPVGYKRVSKTSGREVPWVEIIKGYEYEKGQYLLLDDDELDNVALESTHTIDIDQFVPKSEIDERYIDSPYYIAPDGKVGEDAFAVIRDTIGKLNMVALGRVVLTRREHVIALEPKGRGLLGLTLRYPYEVRDEASYFEDIPDLIPVPDRIGLVPPAGLH